MTGARSASSWGGAGLWGASGGASVSREVVPPASSKGARDLGSGLSWTPALKESGEGPLPHVLRALGPQFPPRTLKGVRLDGLMAFLTLTVQDSRTATPRNLTSIAKEKNNTHPI